jgi:hypothetical protein
MSFFSSTPKKPKDGPGFPRIQYCGFVKAPSGGPTTGVAAKLINQLANNSAEAANIIRKQLSRDAIQDSFGTIIGKSQMYQLSKYLGYTESKSKPGTFYHDYLLSSPGDHFCQSGGKRRTRIFKNTKRRKTRKSRKTRSKR